MCSSNRGGARSRGRKFGVSALATFSASRRFTRFANLLGMELPVVAKCVVAFVIVLALIAGTCWLVRRFGASRVGGGQARGRQPRLAVIDAAAVDSRRRLVLIRRDNVEH